MNDDLQRACLRPLECEWFGRKSATAEGCTWQPASFGTADSVATGNAAECATLRGIGWRSATQVLLCLLVFAGCTSSAPEEGDVRAPLLVMAAASLSAAMPALVEAFETGGGAEVDLVLGSTGNLASQIENGAPADVFFSADEATVERLIASGSLSAGTRRSYAKGILVLAWSDRATDPPASLEELVDERFRVIAIANPEVAPYGAAAREALRAAGVYEELQGRLVQGENIAQTYQFVRTANADAALVALSVMIEAGESPRYVPIDPRLHSPIRQAAAVVSSSGNPAAAEFLDFVAGEGGQGILRKFGFDSPDQTRQE